MNSTLRNIGWVRRALFSFAFVFLCFKSYQLWDYIPDPKQLDAGDEEKWEAVGLDYDSLRSGDLILRHGRGFISDLSATFSVQEAKYSHSGVLRKEGDEIFVYHAIGGEENQSNKMRKDPIELWCHPKAIFEFGIYRYDLNDSELMRYDSILTSWYEQGMEFDLDFDLTTEETMYCSEMIYRALILATNDKNFLPLTEVLDKPYIAVDNLYLNPHCKLLFQYNYD